MLDEREPGLRKEIKASLTDWTVWSTLASSICLWMALWLGFWALVPLLWGWSPLVIQSNSMAPSVRAGDVVIVSDYEVPADQLLAPGTVVAFDGDGEGGLVLHRIYSVGDGFYRTKGDANYVADSTPLPVSEIRGVARILVPWAGLPFHWVQRGDWWLASVAIASLLVAWWGQSIPARTTGGGLVGTDDQQESPIAGRRKVQFLGVVIIAGVATALVATGVARAALGDQTDNVSDEYATGAWQIAATAKFSCRNTSLFEGWCWGENANGQIGDGTTTDRLIPTAVLSPLDEAATSPEGGAEYGCVVKTDATLLCWGRNDKGQLGNGTTTNSSVPVAVVGVGGTGTLSSIVQVVAGGAQSCALDAAGNVYCWGQNDRGQLGNGTTTGSSTPVQVVGVGGVGTLGGVARLAAGSTHVCAVRTDTTVVCWGANGNGQLGNGTTTDSAVPVVVVGSGGIGTLSGAVTVGAGEVHTCASKSDGTVFCWGRNDKGQLGNDTTTDSSSPVQVVGVGGSGTLTDVSDVTAGNRFTCSVSTDTTVVCWGENNEGQLGNGTTTNSSSPVQVLGVGGTGSLAGVIAVAGGELHACAKRSDGTMVCWGRNDRGQLGNGTTTDSEWPVVVLGVGGTGTLTGVDAVGVGAKFSCAVTTGNRMYCWGENAQGQLGNATTASASSPKSVLGSRQDPLPEVLTVAAGLKHSCMSLMDLTVYCWGRNDKGQLGDGTTADRATLGSVVATTGSGHLTGIRQVVAGDEHTCALRAGTTVVCWGRNDKGQLGNNAATGDTPIPQQVSGVGGTGFLTGIAWLSAGAKHTCAASLAGNVLCWGLNASGQLGDNTTTDRAVPVQVVGVGGIGVLGSMRQVGVGSNHSCAVSTAAQVYCWGSNSSGQLGDLTTLSRSTPLLVLGVGGVGTLSNIRWVDGGSEHSCATSLADTVFCWGRNDRGQVGDGTVVSPRTTPRQVVSPSGSGVLTPVSAVAAGSEHSCAFRRDATSGYCWGRNDKGQLGIGGGADSSIPVATSGP